MAFFRRQTRENLPIFVSTIEKSGTKLLQEILIQITGRKIQTPKQDDYLDYKRIEQSWTSPGGIFVWHNLITAETAKELRKARATPIFLMRNVFDQLGSLYHHLANDVDREAGFATNTHSVFKEWGQANAISSLISGCQSVRFTSAGIEHTLEKMESYVDTAKETNALLLTYELLINEKTDTINKLAKHVGYPVTPENLSEIEQATLITTMKKRAAQSTRSELIAQEYIAPTHFNNGRVGESRKLLTEPHVAMVHKIINTQFPKLRSKLDKKGIGFLLDYEI